MKKNQPAVKIKPTIQAHGPAQLQPAMLPAKIKPAIQDLQLAKLQTSIPAAMGKTGYKVPCPVLCRLPNMMTKDLSLKLSHNGVTMPFQVNYSPRVVDGKIIKDPPFQGRYRQRYMGGQSVVDPNGKLYLTKKEFLDAQAAEEQERQAYKNNLAGIVIANAVKQTAKKIRAGSAMNLPGNTDPVLRENKATKKDQETKAYIVNKREVNNRLQTMCNAMFSAVKQSAFLGMLTVSFPPCVSEDIAAQALNTWLTALRQKGKRVIRQYLWVSEKQQNGTIHYHMLILNRVNIVYANRQMRVTLCNLVRAGVIDYPLSGMKRYNGVDLAKDRRTRQVINFIDPKSRKALSGYITKYVTKNNERFKHAAWNCSRGFSCLFTAITCTREEFLKMSWEVKAAQDPVITNEWFMFFPWVKDTGPPVEFVLHLAQLNAHILERRGFLN